MTFAVLTWLVLGVTTLSLSDAGVCPTCSYVISAVPSVGYECVDDVYASPHTKNISCDFSTHSCSILVDYNTPDYTVLRSISRMCQAGSPKGVSCNSDTPAQCTFACRSDHCNTQDGDLGRYFRGSGSTGDNSGGRNGSGVLSLGLCLLLVAAWRRHLGL